MEASDATVLEFPWQPLSPSPKFSCTRGGLELCSLPRSVIPCFSQGWLLSSFRPLLKPHLPYRPLLTTSKQLISPTPCCFPPSTGNHQRLVYFIISVMSVSQSVTSVRTGTLSVLFTAASLVPRTGSGTQSGFDMY